MDGIKKRLPYVLICASSFYLLPLLGGSTGSFMAILLLITPLICFFTSFAYGFKHGWDFAFPVGIGMLFIPAIFIHYNDSAWVYAVIYASLSCLGVLGGKRK